jgi:hypothetical protein
LYCCCWWLISFTFFACWCAHYTIFAPLLRLSRAHKGCRLVQ